MLPTAKGPHVAHRRRTTALAPAHCPWPQFPLHFWLLKISFLKLSFVFVLFLGCSVLPNVSLHVSLERSHVISCSPAVPHRWPVSCWEPKGLQDRHFQNKEAALNECFPLVPLWVSPSGRAYSMLHWTQIWARCTWTPGWLRPEWGTQWIKLAGYIKSQLLWTPQTSWCHCSFSLKASWVSRS